MKTIVAKHPVREFFADCSTGSDGGYYYSTKGHAINAFDGRLQEYDLCLDRNEFVDYNGDDGRTNHQVVDEFGHCVGCAVFSWHRMPSGKYEFIGYLA